MFKQKALYTSLIILALSINSAYAQTKQVATPDWAKPVAAWPNVNNEITQSISKIVADASVKKAVESLKTDEAQTLQQTITLTEIPAPTFKEAARAKAFMDMLKAAGLTDVRIDKTGNVIGIRKGTGKGPVVVLDAHLDTVFPEGTDVKVKQKDGKYYAPGITDDTHALAVLVSWVKALNTNKIKTIGDLMIVGSVGEEGNGDLNGVKALFNENTIDAYLGLEAVPVGVVVPMNTATFRYEVKYTAPGGHSYGAFGQVPSAIHAMGRAIADIANIKAKTVPRTTYNVGVVSGGRSVNTISPDATMEIDLRSDSAQELSVLDKKVLAIIQKSVDDENKFIGKGQLVTVSIKKIGDRPGGMTPNNAPIIQAALGSIRAMGQKEVMMIGIGSNAGVPISKNIPAIVISPGGTFEGFHALNEGMDPTNSYIGSQIGLITALSLAGVADVSTPVISVKK